MLIFEQFDAFDQARLALRDPSCVAYGDETGPVAIAPYGSHRFVADCRRDAGGAGCLFAVPCRLDRAAQFRRMARFQFGRRPTGKARRTRRPRITANRSAPDLPRTIRTSWCSTANSRRNPSTRCFSSRKAGSAGTMRKPRRLNSCSACSRLTRPLKRLPICLATRGLFQAGAHQDPVRLYGRRLRRTRSFDHAALYRAGRRCSFPIGRCGSRSTAIEQFQCGIKRHAFKMHTRIGIDRATGKISGFAADHVLDGGGLANFSNTVSTSAPSRLSASTTFRKSISPRSRCIRAALPRDRCAVTARCKR